MARGIVLTLKAAEVEVNELGQLITSCSHIPTRNRYTARRSRLVKYLEHMASKQLMVSQQTTISRLRAQVDLKAC